MAKSIVGRVHDNVAKANGQREEHLGDSCIPHLGLEQFVPLRLQEVEDTISGSRQSQGTHQQYEHNDIGEQRQEVGRLAGALDAAEHNAGYNEPSDSQSQRQAPTGIADAVVNA